MKRAKKDTVLHPLRLWQARMSMDGHQAAKALGLKYMTWVFYYTGRRPTPPWLKLLCWYVETFGVRLPEQRLPAVPVSSRRDPPLHDDAAVARE